MANAIPVHSGTEEQAGEKPQVKQKPEAKKPAAKQSEPKIDDKPKRGEPYTLPSGTICIDH